MDRGQFPEQNTDRKTQKSTINKWYLMKLRSYCSTKDTIIQTKLLPTEMGKDFDQLHNRRLVSKIYINLKNIDIKKINESVGCISKHYF